MKLTKTQEAEAQIAHDLYWECYLKDKLKALSTPLNNQNIQAGLENLSSSGIKDLEHWASLEDQLTGDIKMHNRSSKSKSVDGFVFFKEECDLYVFKEFEWTFYSKFVGSSLMQKKDNRWKMIHHQYSMPKVDTQKNESMQMGEISGKNKLQNREVVKS